MVKRLTGLLMIAGLLAAGAALSGCASQETGGAVDQVKTVKLDYAYYNPVSLVLKEKKWVEEELEQDGISVEWVQSAGSNKALELLNSNSIDFGSTAGAAALLGRANGNPIKAVYIYSKPEWTALVTSANSDIKTVQDLKGKKIAVTRGTDPHIFLLRALDQAGLSEKDVELVQLQHADGKAALEKGDVDAWAGLDPFMAQSELENQSKLFFRNPDWNTYGFLNVRESFANDHPEIVDKVLAAYERGRKWALENPQEFVKLVAAQSQQTEEVAAKVLGRTDLSDPIIGDTHKKAIQASSEVLLKSGVIDKSTNTDTVIAELIEPKFALKLADH